MILYRDVQGNQTPLPPGRRATWRTSCYAIIERNGLLLMTRPVDGPFWELPGGGIEPEIDASLTHAAIRECYEETGHTLVPESAAPRFGGEFFIHALRTDRYLNALTFYVWGEIDGAPDPAWLATPTEAVVVDWLPPAALTRETAIWFQIEALRALGVFA